jgi:hypothetical protein
LKQKFIALLKRFRVSEDLQGLDNDQEAIGQQLSGECTLRELTENRKLFTPHNVVHYALSEIYFIYESQLYSNFHADRMTDM